MSNRPALHAFVLLLLMSVPGLAQTPLTVVSAAPTGEIGTLEQAAEIRIRFSEPMIAIGRVAGEVAVPFVTVRPAITGTFRWAGPTILVLTPAPGTPLPNATTYQVTVSAAATAVSGRRLEQPYAFSFTTPTVRLLRTRWYRQDGRFDRPLTIVLHFNQPVRTPDVLAHAQLRYEAHDWDVPVLTATQRTRMGAGAVAAFDAKVVAARAVARSTTAVRVSAAADWDRTAYPPAPEMVVLQTADAPAPGGFLSLRLDRQLPAASGPATPAAQQTYTIRLEEPFFVDNFTCQAECDADGYNDARLRAPVLLDGLQRAATVQEISNPARPVVVAPVAAPAREREGDEAVESFSVEDLGYGSQPPSSTYAITLNAALTATDGQVLGYTFVGTVGNWHNRSFTSFGDGHGVWERSGGTQLPFYARNLTSATQWVMPIRPDQLMPTIRDLEQRQFAATPPIPGVRRTLGGTADEVNSYGLDLTRALANGAGLVWAAVQPGPPIARSRPYDEANTARASVVQVTNLGITVKDSPLNTLVFVTRLDTAEPVADAEVSIIGLDNQTRWRGRTDGAGVALAPQTRLRNPGRWYEFAFLVTAAKDGDVAYVASDWNEGISPYEFGTPLDLFEAGPLLRGTVFTDRGVYRPGEEVHVKAVLRADDPAGISLFKSSTPIYIAVRDSRDRTVDQRTVMMNDWSTAEWTMRVPASGALGQYQIVAATSQQAIDRDRTPPADDDDPDQPPSWKAQLRGSFLVAAYRRPDFRVDATLTADRPVAGVPLVAEVGARYLFGAAMGKRPVRWTYSRSPLYQAPPAVADRYPFSRFTFVGCCEGDTRAAQEEVAARSVDLDAAGRLRVELETRPGDGLPYTYMFEADVEDASRQHIANRASILVHPASWYIGLQRPAFFVDQAEGLNTAVVAVSPTGSPVAGVAVEITLYESQWNSVRRAEGNGFYEWETERKEVEVGTFRATSGNEPVPLSIPVSSGGLYLVKATARDPDGRLAVTRMSFYVLGAGYTAWERYDHNRIDLVPEQESYKPGDTARLMIKSPWERATALLTVEREGIRSHRQFALTSTQQMVEVPITAGDIPNVYVSVLLVKGRTVAGTEEEAGDPGKPAFRLGYASLKVEDASKRLTVAVKANREEFKPAGTAKVEVTVADVGGAGLSSEVTLWAVDYGVLSLTNFQTPDVLGSVYVAKALQVLNSDSRQRIVSRRVLTPKGADSGGGGGAGEAGANEIRRDFRVLAFWLGSVITDSRGRASIDVKLPESLTTYRIMAVSGDRASRFGSGESEIRINKPVVLKPAFPRFLTRGDTATFGSVVTSQLKSAGSAVVTMKSLDPGVLEVTGGSRRVVQVPANGSIEVRFDVAGRATGRGRLQMSVRLQGQSDAFEESVPVEVLAAAETYAAYGEANPGATERLAVPADAIPGFGGLHLELASTALVGLGEGARYVVEYPYGCVEQRASRAFVMLLAADLGGAFNLPGIDPRELRPRAQTALRELESFQCPSGGFAFWPGDCRGVSPYLTSYVLQVYQQAAALKYDVGPEVLSRAYTYLDEQLALPPPPNEGWRPAYTAWQASAAAVLTAAGRNQDANLTRLFAQADRMPIFGLTALHDAMRASRPGDPRIADLRRRIGNAILPEAGSVHVEEITDPYLLYFWNSNVRSTAIVLQSLVKAGDRAADIPGMVRWLIAARTNGRWSNTQENAWALQALASYYRAFESQAPDFTAVVRLGTEELVKETFKGRSTSPVAREIPMARLAPGRGAPPAADAAAGRELSVQRTGAGSLFYTARLTYARDGQSQQPIDSGFQVSRQYAPLTEGNPGEPSTSFAAGELIQVTLTLDLPKERRFVAVTDPLPAGFEAVESWFATTAAQVRPPEADADQDANEWAQAWQRGTFDHVERHDDRVLLFATRLGEGRHVFSYVVRATTAGTFQVAPVTVEEMYSPEVFGRTATGRAVVTP